MMVIIAVAGWCLFAAIFILYRAGNRINIRETQALALHSLALTLSDDFRTGIRKGTEEFIIDHCQNTSTEELAFGLTQAVTETAKRYHTNTPNNSDVDTLTLVIATIDNIKVNQRAEQDAAANP